jgi:hypothetical protein
LRSENSDESVAEVTNSHSFAIPWQKTPSKKSRQILIPHGTPRDRIRPTKIERRARLVTAIARGRRWLDEIVSGKAADIKQIAVRQKCSERHVNMTISLTFLAPGLVKAAVDGRCQEASASNGCATLQRNGACNSKLLAFPKPDL